jgi:hypothetical protein
VGLADATAASRRSATGSACRFRDGRFDYQVSLEKPR